MSDEKRTDQALERQLRADAARKETALELILAQVIVVEDPAVTLQSIASIAHAALAPPGDGKEPK